MVTIYFFTPSFLCYYNNVVFIFLLLGVLFLFVFSEKCVYLPMVYEELVNRKLLKIRSVMLDLLIGT